MAAQEASPIPSVEGSSHAHETYETAFYSYDQKPIVDPYTDFGIPETRRKVVVKKKRKNDTLFKLLCDWVLDHQIGLSVNLLLLLTLTHMSFPRARRRTRKFFEMSYYNPSTGRYTQGWDDFCFVTFWIVVFTGLRAATMDHVFAPFAAWAGIEKKKTKVRFAEQGWVFLYYSVLLTLGLYLMYTSKYWFNLREVWADFPTHEMSGLMKWYYLVQFAFWLQQIVIVNIEERRKDHWQMFTHHIFTCALIFTSYGFYQTKVGNVILCIMDVVDIVFVVAKLLKYLGFQTPCDIAFGVFMFSWFAARHVCYLLVCWSIYADVPTIMPYGCYSSTTGERLSSNGGSEVAKNILQSFNDPAGVVCFNRKIQMGFLALLLGLQVILLVWFGMIMRVAYRVLKGCGADDSRSDDEDEEEYEDEEVEDIDRIPGFAQHTSLDGSQEYAHAKSAQPLEEEVGVEGLHFVRHASPTVRGRLPRRTSARTSGISIPGHSDRKELLGRIGCDKPI